MHRRRPDCLVAVVLAAVVLLAAPASKAGTCAPGFGLCSPSPAVVYANPHWSIQLTSYGYSDFVIYHLPPFPRWNPADSDGPPPLHEMFSGEWAFAVSYNGVVTWLEPCFVYPDWLTNSNFIVEIPINFPGDRDADGMLEGFSVISNPDLRVRIDYDFEVATDGVNFGTAMGLGALAPMMSRLSNRYVLKQSFELENISGGTLSDLRLIGMAAPHPANTEYAGSDAAYDADFYGTGGFQDYFWDLTVHAVNSGITDGTRTGSTFDDAVSYSVNVIPGAWDIDTYKGHTFGDDGITMDVQDALDHGLKPLSGTHCNIENMAMNNQTVLTGEEIAAGFRLDAGNLGAGMTWSGDVLLALDSRSNGIRAPVCAHILETGGHPRLTFSKGACVGGKTTAMTYDIAMGSKYDLFRVPSCGSGPMGAFDCSALINLVCKAKQHGLDRITLDDDAHPTDLLYYVARPSGTFTSWGEGQNGTLSPAPLLRFHFTPSTASGIDVCDFGPSLASPPAPDTPGIGHLEEVRPKVLVPPRETLLP